MVKERIYCDLNVTESSSYQDNLDNVKQLVSLGYTMVALNRHYGLPKKESGTGTNNNKNNKKNNSNPSNAIGKSAMDEAKKFVDEAQTLHKRLNSDIEKLRGSTIILADEQDTAANQSNVKEAELVVPEKFRLLSRVTLDLDNVEQLNYLRSRSNKLIASSFDLVAVNPRCEKCFRSLMELKFDALDIVAFDLSDRLPFKFDRHQVGLGTSNGLFFEVQYGTAIRSQTLRKYVFSNSQQLTSRTKRGAGVIVTSGGESKMDFRAPPDVANLTSLFGLKGMDSGLDTVSTTARKCVRRALLRRETFKGAVRVEKMEEEADRAGAEPASKKLRVE